MLRWYPCPGNVRELENVIEEAIVMNQGRELAEKQAVAEALSAAQGRPEEAARRLQVSRAIIYRKIKKYGLSTRRLN